MRLPNLQEAFVTNALFDECEALIDSIISNEVTAAERMAAYKNNVYVGLFEALKNTYPTVVSLVGEDFFRGVVHHFVRAEPPKAANLDDYGAGLADFLGEYAPAKELGYLPDVARFDWAIHECSNAENDVHLNAKVLAQLGDKIVDSTFSLRSAVRLIHSQHPLDTIWHICQQPESTEKIEILQSPRYYIVYRADDFSVWFEQIDEAYFVMLKGFASNLTLQQVLEIIVKQNGDFDLSAFFTFVIQREVLKG